MPDLSDDQGGSALQPPGQTQNHAHQSSVPTNGAVHGSTASGNGLAPQATAAGGQAGSATAVNRHESSRARHHHQGSSSTKSYTSSGPTVVGGHFKVGKKIGEGSFGIIYEGTNLKTNEQIAIKFEPRKAETPQLRDEYRTYKLLVGLPGIPKCYYFGQEGLHSVLVLELLGPSLEDAFDLCGRHFTLKTVCMLAKNMIRRMQTVHEGNLVYRDIKPDNFLIGRIPRFNEKVTDDPSSPDPYSIVQNHSPQHPSPCSLLYLVDYGMVKQYRDPRTHIHIPFREKKSLSGTARYMSIHTHLGREQGRRDDIEALCHVFFYLLNSHLPWQGLRANSNRQKYERIGEVKQAVSIEALGHPNPPEFGYLLDYARNMNFDEEPNYEGMIDMIDQVMKRHGLEDDGLYDWLEVLDQERAAKRRRDEIRATMSEEERREDERREREERVEKERALRVRQEEARQRYERKIVHSSPALMNRIHYFPSFVSSQNAARVNDAKIPPIVKQPPVDPATRQSSAALHKNPLTAGTAAGSSVAGSPRADPASSISTAAAGRASAQQVKTTGGAGHLETPPQAVAASAAAAQHHAIGPTTTAGEAAAQATDGGRRKKRKWYKRMFGCFGRHESD
ncbi:kinase-like domain-containing protein [Fimicolochytrium jonesii]|uniref:kinase-like domain-containing protein n=1 Tax=Fimicolochytrium jonesii TaxID=1396493 RepID=UPI0022FE25A4|nr:kinase-like domain-containing protein [Fimicolochytrium jonesii]KAI8826012.1 kinase-like domain-containing protein [Fimicolochytrium jonesii]